VDEPSDASDNVEHTAECGNPR